MADARTNPGTAFERSDVSLRLIGWLALGLLATLLILPGVLMVSFPATLHERPSPLPPAVPRTAPPLQTDPTADLRALRAAETRRLTGYGWIDRAQGLVHIPIEEAMRRTAERGIAGWPGGAGQ